MTCDHTRPAVVAQKSVLDVCAAVLDADPDAAAAAADSAPCPQCAIVTAVQFGFAVVATIAGQEPVMSEELRSALAAMVEDARREIRGSAN